MYKFQRKNFLKGVQTLLRALCKTYIHDKIDCKRVPAPIIGKRYYVQTRIYQLFKKL